MWCSQGNGAGSINQEWSSEQCDEMVESNLTQSLKYFQNVSDVEAKYEDMPQSLVLQAPRMVGRPPQRLIISLNYHSMLCKLGLYCTKVSSSASSFCSPGGAQFLLFINIFFKIFFIFLFYFVLSTSLGFIFFSTQRSRVELFFHDDMSLTRPSNFQ